MSRFTAAQRWKANGMTALAIVLAGVSAAATLERSHWLATHFDDGASSTVVTEDPAPAQSSVFPTGSPPALTNPGGVAPAGGVAVGGSSTAAVVPTGGASGAGTTAGASGAAGTGFDVGAAANGSLSSSPTAGSPEEYRQSVVVAQVRALTAIAAVKACKARLGKAGYCTQPTENSLGTDTGLSIVHKAPEAGEVRVLRNGQIYSATAAAQRGIWYAVTVNTGNGAESRTCFSHHGKQRCKPPTW